MRLAKRLLNCERALVLTFDTELDVHLHCFVDCEINKIKSDTNVKFLVAKIIDTDAYLNTNYSLTLTIIRSTHNIYDNHN